MNSSYENAFPTADEDYAKRKTIFKMGEEKKSLYITHPETYEVSQNFFFFFKATWLHLGKIIIPFSLRGTPKGRKTGNAQKSHPIPGCDWNMLVHDRVALKPLP